MLVFEENVLIKLTKRQNPSANPQILVWAEGEEKSWPNKITLYEYDEWITS